MVARRTYGKEFKIEVFRLLGLGDKPATQLAHAGVVAAPVEFSHHRAPQAPFTQSSMGTAHLSRPQPCEDPMPDPSGAIIPLVAHGGRFHNPPSRAESGSVTRSYKSLHIWGGSINRIITATV
jgi:hypothetical protein